MDTQTPARPLAAFVSGMKKSGTTWVANLLGLHPQVLVTGELHLELAHEALRAYAAPDWIPLDVAAVDELWPEVAMAIVRHHRAAKLGAAGGVDAGAADTLLVDHTPGWPALHLGAAARYVHVVRDPRDVIVSDAFHSMRMGEYPPEIEAEHRAHIDAWRADPWYFEAHPERLVHPAEVDRLARTWVDIVRSARTLADAHPDLVLVVRYRDLHTQFPEVLRTLLRFLCLDPHDLADPVPDELQPAFGGRGEDPHAFNRKGVVGDHVPYLSPEQRAVIAEIAGDLMAELGYDVD